MKQLGLALLILALLVAWTSPVAALTPLERLQTQQLRATHEAVQRLAGQRRPVPSAFGFRDIRAVLHVHSSLSHDSTSKLEEILPAAKAAGINAILFTEHPGARFDYFSDGHQGLHDGVLLVPGAETEGLLLFPTHSMAGEMPSGDEQARAQALVDRATRGGGLAFLSHLEARMDWNLEHLTGSEIYNTHGDLKQDGRFIDFTSPLALTLLMSGLEHYPQETLAAFQNYPTHYLRRYDELCQSGRLTGVAACDAHHNQVYRIVVNAKGGYDVVDFRGARMLSLPALAAAMLRATAERPTAGTVVWKADLDPYERMLRHVTTHLLVEELSRPAVWQALREGRAYVSFDWMADPTGFVFQTEMAGQHRLLGSELALGAGLVLRAATPLPCRLKLLRNGHEIEHHEGDHASWPIRDPGVYRVEAWLELAGELRPWILANPIYIRQ
jgi:hypothetical protein